MQFPLNSGSSMWINLHRKDLDVSKYHLEVGKMSSLAEMNTLVHEAADIASNSHSWKDRVTAAARAFGFGWERTKAFYYQTARRVEAGEMDDARQAVRRLRDLDRRRKAAEHAEWLRRTVECLREDGRQLDSDSLDVLERLVGVVGADGGAVVAVAKRREVA